MTKITMAAVIIGAVKRTGAVYRGTKCKKKSWQQIVYQELSLYMACTV